MKYRYLIPGILLLALLITGCRVRTTLIPEPPEITEAPAAASQSPTPTAAPETTPTVQPEPTPAPTPEPAPEPSPAPVPEATREVTPDPEPTPEPEQPLTDPDAPTEQDEESERREFSPEESGEITPGAEEPVVAPSENAETAAGMASANGGGAAVETGSGEQTVTETVPEEEAEDLGADETGETADSVQTYYLTLLSDRVGDLFECKRLYVYWESAEDYLTVFKTSQEHKLILGAGAYDVSAKLLEENLTVDDGWVMRKNPEAIVKVLGTGAFDAQTAASVCAALSARTDWDGIDAVQNRRILILSQRLLDTQAGRTAAMVYLAKLMYPEQLADVDADEALRSLTEEADGTAWLGQYAYMMQG